MAGNSGETPYANSIFEQPWWLDIVAPNSWDELLVKNGDDVIARWPIVHKGNKAFMPKETQTIGPWFRHVDGEREYDRLSRVKNSVNQLLEQLDVRYWDYALAPECDYVLPFIWNGFQAHPRFTYVINDLSDIDFVESQFNKTAKKNIKRASKVVEVRNVFDPSVIIQSMTESFAAQNRGLPVSEMLIEAIVLEAISRSRGYLLAAYDAQEQCHASSLFLYDENRCFYLLSGSNPALRTSGAQTLILREGIRFAAKHSKVFDFEGSMIEGIEKFFRQFGGIPETYYRIVRQGAVGQIKEIAKPKIKKLLHYK